MLAGASAICCSKPAAVTTTVAILPSSWVAPVLMAASAAAWAAPIARVLQTAADIKRSADGMALLLFTFALSICFGIFLRLAASASAGAVQVDIQEAAQCLALVALASKARKRPDERCWMSAFDHRT